MSDRKVLNKYYSPDFDPSKLSRLKREKSRQFAIRLMAPFNMRCQTCGEYIYRGRKFNATKEDVIGGTYLGIQIYRFYIKCTKCLAEITFVTDPSGQDYQLENGAIRNFESLRIAQKQAEIEATKKKDEEENDPMKMLESRTQDSKREMAILEALEDLRELNTANEQLHIDVLLKRQREIRQKLEEAAIKVDEEEIRRIFGSQKHTVSSIEEIVDEVTTEARAKKRTNSESENVESIRVIKRVPKAAERSTNLQTSSILKPSDLVGKFMVNKKTQLVLLNPLTNIASYGEGSSDED